MRTRISTLLYRLKQIHTIKETSRPITGLTNSTTSTSRVPADSSRWSNAASVRYMGIGSFKEGNRAGQHGVMYPHAKADGSPEKDEVHLVLNSSSRHVHSNPTIFLCCMHSRRVRLRSGAGRGVLDLRLGCGIPADARVHDLLRKMVCFGVDSHRRMRGRSFWRKRRRSRRMGWRMRVGKAARSCSLGCRTARLRAKPSNMLVKSSSLAPP